MQRRHLDRVSFVSSSVGRLFDVGEREAYGFPSLSRTTPLGSLVSERSSSALLGSACLVGLGWSVIFGLLTLSLKIYIAD